MIVSRVSAMRKAAIWQGSFTPPASLAERITLPSASTAPYGPSDAATSARVVCRQTIMRGGELILEALVENVCVSLDGRPRRLPKLLMERVAGYLPETVVAANDVVERVMMAAE